MREIGQERDRQQAQHPSGRRSSLDVALVIMPFASTMAPSIQVGLLQSIARLAGHRCNSYYFNLDLARELGVDPYERLAHLPLPLLGEWLFSAVAFADTPPDPDDHFLSTIDLAALERRLDLSGAQLRGIRHQIVPALIDRIASECSGITQCDIVGFSSVFQQTVASIALARRIKTIAPQVVTIFGGANFQGQMGIELLKKVSCIDYVAIGESDESFPKFLDAIAEGHEVLDVPNIIGRAQLEQPPQSQRLTTGLDQLPIPDYDDFFARAEDLGLVPAQRRSEIELPIEASRGCWWGAKHHCVFCGLDAATMKYRRKSPERVLRELSEQTERYGTFRFLTTDAIVDMEHLKTLFPAIAQARFGFDLFFEVKSNLRREQLRSLRHGGVARIQPGIESLSSKVLSLIDKGVTGIQNINFLRWSRYFDFAVDWNFIWGFPGEDEQSYFDMAKITERLHHLQPPANVGPVQMHRFSPIFHDRRRFPVHFMKAEAGYGFAFPPDIDLDAIAYYFDFKFEAKLPEDGHNALRAAVDQWRARWKMTTVPKLTYQFAPGIVVIDDSRPCERSIHYTLRGAIANLYNACSDYPNSLERLLSRSGDEFSTKDIAEALDDLVERGLMISEGDIYLSLALPAGGPI